MHLSIEIPTPSPPHPRAKVMKGVWIRFESMFCPLGRGSPQDLPCLIYFVRTGFTSLSAPVGWEFLTFWYDMESSNPHPVPGVGEIWISIDKCISNSVSGMILEFSLLPHCIYSYIRAPWNRIKRLQQTSFKGPQTIGLAVSYLITWFLKWAQIFLTLFIIWMHQKALVEIEKIHHRTCLQKNGTLPHYQKADVVLPFCIMMTASTNKY